MVQSEEMTHDRLKMTYDEAKMTHDSDKTNKERILEFCSIPRTIHEIMEVLGFKERKSARRYVKPLLEQGRLAMTLPDKPQSKNQKYITIK